jgi:arylsulfatase A-like enzyme
LVLASVGAWVMVSPALRREASCTGGPGKLYHGRIADPHRAHHVGQAGSPLGMPDEAPTIATVLKTMGYATGQFGKNHLGDLNQFLPTLHGFDEFFGYLYHLDAMEDSCHRNYPQTLKEPLHRPAQWLAWRHGEGRLADPDQSAAGPV